MFLSAVKCGALRVIHAKRKGMNWILLKVGTFTLYIYVSKPLFCLTIYNALFRVRRENESRFSFYAVQYIAVSITK
jgi:hypothetical protein